MTARFDPKIKDLDQIILRPLDPGTIIIMTTAKDIVNIGLFCLADEQTLASTTSMLIQNALPTR